MTIDVMDVSGETQNGVEDNIFKLRLDQNGNNLTSNPEKQGMEKYRFERFFAFRDSVRDCMGVQNGLRTQYVVF